MGRNVLGWKKLRSTGIFHLFAWVFHRNKALSFKEANECSIRYVGWFFFLRKKCFCNPYIFLCSPQPNSSVYRTLRSPPRPSGNSHWPWRVGWDSFFPVNLNLALLQGVLQNKIFSALFRKPRLFYLFSAPNTCRTKGVNNWIWK